MTDEKMEWASIPAKHSYRQSPDSLEKLHALMDEYTASGGFFSTFRPFRRNP
ncbi:hypothetical protein [Tateyamaria sp. ANG-S1]|uniref:hypothetical protein n=1 Tax=Tateyamaria sp. ANG-S1 TaxID=1577905 RepID=UPI00187CC135|nr:hypothetical protein [Tateyamaria sp. ANG-S1]